MDAAIEEDVQGVAVSSYQGGHIEYFEYLVESLRERGADHVHVVGGGGGVIVHDEIDRLRSSGVTIFSPEDGQRLGLPGMINSVVRGPRLRPVGEGAGHRRRRDHRRPGRDRAGDHRRRGGQAARRRPSDAPRPGRGQHARPGARHHRHRRLRQVQPHRRARTPLPHRPAGQAPGRGHRRRPDPAQGRRRAARRPDPDEQPRSATADLLPLARHPGRPRAAGLPRRRHHACSRRPASTSSSSRRRASARATRPWCRSSTPRLYVMTPEFGAASQLEKIDMLDFADVVAINKFERRGAEDAMRDVGRQLVRNREAFGKKPEDMPVFGTSAATFNDDGVTALYQYLAGLLAAAGPAPRGRRAPAASTYDSPRSSARWSRPTGSATSPRSPRRSATTTPTPRCWRTPPSGCSASSGPPTSWRPRERRTKQRTWAECPSCSTWSASRSLRSCRTRSPSGPPSSSEYADHPGRESLSGNRVPRVVAPPAYTDHGELVRYWRRENLPGKFPFTAGVFAFKRENEDPARMFAGEGDPARTNRRFKVLSEGLPADPAVDGVRLGHALRPRPRRAARTSTARSARPASASRRSTT